MDLDRRVLLTAPWCWPPPQSRGRDLLVETLGPVPALPPGRAPAVTVRGETVTLWCLDAGSRPEGVPYAAAPGFSRAPLGPEARASWQAVALAIPRSLPVVWRRVHDVARELPVGTFLRSHLDVAGFEERERVLDGHSFGLAFFLLLASRVLDLPLPEDVVAAAGVNERGYAFAVDALPARLAGLAAMAPSLRRLLVCADQVKEARAATANSGIEVIGVTSGADALVQLFDPVLSDRLIEAGIDAERRAELVDAFFRLALVGRGAALNWSPIERGATIALREWPLVDDQEYRLQFAAAVAARHARNAGELPLPDEMTPRSWLERQPAPIRLTLLTQLVQQSVDAGTPPWPRTEALALRALPARFEDALLPHLKLMGALARLWAITGREVTALVLDRRLARAFAEAFAEEDVSWPLAEVFRLSGVLHDRGAFEDADDLREQVMTVGGFGLRGAPHVELARARALVMLGRLDEAGLDQLHALAHERGVPAHVRWSASRWFVRGLRERRHDDKAAEHLSRLEQEVRADTRDGLVGERFLVLAHLDVALASGDAARAASLVAHLQKLDPGPLGHLLAVSTDAAFIGSRYPH